VPFLDHQDNAKIYPHRYGAGKQRTNLIWPGGGNNVIISGFHTTQGIAHTSTYEIGFMTGIL
jgi:hypothetical protein